MKIMWIYIHIPTTPIADTHGKGIKNSPTILLISITLWESGKRQPKTPKPFSITPMTGETAVANLGSTKPQLPTP